MCVYSINNVLRKYVLHVYSTFYDSSVFFKIVMYFFKIVRYLEESVINFTYRGWINEHWNFCSLDNIATHTCTVQKYTTWNMKSWLQSSWGIYSYYFIHNIIGYVRSLLPFGYVITCQCYENKHIANHATINHVHPSLTEWLPFTMVDSTV